MIDRRRSVSVPPTVAGAAQARIEQRFSGGPVGANGAAISWSLRGAGAAEAWRSAVDDLPHDCAFDAIGPEAGFTADYTERRIGEIVVADVRGAPLMLRERRAPSGPQTLLQAVVDGQPVYRSVEGESVTLRPGQLVVRRCLPGAVLWSDRQARVVTAFVAQHLLAPRFATAAALNGFTLLVDNALPPRLLYNFVVGLADADGALSSARVAAIDALGGLLSMVLAQLPQAPEPLSELAARRATDVLSYLKRNFSNPALTPSIMAEDLGISVRYAHKLMGMTGRSFRQELIAQRLSAARAAFAGNRKPRQTIADIAISVGFNDLSQFNRHFRTAFGITPRAARKIDEIRGWRPDNGEAEHDWDRTADQLRRRAETNEPPADEGALETVRER
jgi:AraC-like DNA-binding protein